MIRSLLVGTAVLVLTACTGDEAPERPSQVAQLGGLSFEVPADWHHIELGRQGATVSMWSPDGPNPRKETITIVRGDQPIVAGFRDGTGVQNVLERAQGTLPGARLSAVRTITTAQGLSGARLEVDFAPLEPAQIYHRIHVVLADGAGFVNVLYTAKDPDPSTDVMDLVLGSLRRGEG
ncbi:MAG: hypothetical protein IPQ07_19745 [Myxococcales bacterium]|nr:hypothetical protein [Myxococcales bacterium]